MFSRGFSSEQGVFGGLNLGVIVVGFHGSTLLKAEVPNVYYEPEFCPDFSSLRRVLLN